MPTIPVLNNGLLPQTSNAPSFARDNLARPTVNLSGAIGAVGRLADTAGAPVLMSDALAAPAGAVAGLGRAIDQAGGVVEALMVKRREAKVKNQTFDNEMAMAEAANKLAEFQRKNQTDPDSWEAYRQTVVAGLEKSFATNDKLLPETRDHLTRKLREFDVSTAGRTFEDSSKMTFSLARSAYFAEMDRAADTGDRASWDRSAGEAAEKGYAYPHEIENGRQQFDARQESKQRQATAEADKAYISGLVSTAMVDNAGWLDRNRKPGPGDNVENWMRARSLIEANARDEAGFAITDATGMIAKGQITVPSEIDALEMPGLNLEMRASLKKSLAGFDHRAALEEQRVNGEKNFLAAWQNARSWQGGTTPEKVQEYFKIVEGVRYGVPEEHQERIIAALNQKMNLTTRPAEPEPEAEQAATRAIGALWDDGTFNGGKPMRKFNAATGLMEEDTAATFAAGGVEGAVKIRVRKYLEAHPETRPEDVPDIVRMLLPDGLRASTLRNLQGSLNFGGVQVPKSGDIGQAKVTVFGGPRDPDDNGLSAFGGKTGPGGREGVAVPEKILKHVLGDDRKKWEAASVEATLPDGRKFTLPIADLGTAERVWKRDGQPVMDLTEGAVKTLGGSVIYDRKGNMRDVKGIKGASFRIVAPGLQPVPFDPGAGENTVFAPTPAGAPFSSTDEIDPEDITLPPQ